MTGGEELYKLVAELYPICRSITGDGVRRTLEIIDREVGGGLEVTEVPTGTQVLDWTVPREWNVRDAWVADPSGRKVIDFQASNLHLVSYSVPVRARLPLAELKEHLFTLPDHPDWVPYRTSYYQDGWGFCLAHLARRTGLRGVDVSDDHRHGVAQLLRAVGVRLPDHREAEQRRGPQ